MLFKSPIWIACYDNPSCTIEDFALNISPGNTVKEFDELKWIMVDIESNQKMFRKNKNKKSLLIVNEPEDLSFLG